MGKYIYGSLHGDLTAADMALAQAVSEGDLVAQQKACNFALASIMKSFPEGMEFATLFRISNGLSRVSEGVADELFRPVNPGRARPSPERFMDALAVMLLDLFTQAGLQRTASFSRVAKLMAGAGMTSHGGGRQADSDHAGISRGVTANTIKALWNTSRPGKRLQKVGETANESIRRLRLAGAAMDSIEDVEAIFRSIATQAPMSVVDLLTTPSRSETY